MYPIHLCSYLSVLPLQLRSKPVGQLTSRPAPGNRAQGGGGTCMLALLRLSASPHMVLGGANTQQEEEEVLVERSLPSLEQLRWVLSTTLRGPQTQLEFAVLKRAHFQCAHL